MNFLADLSRKMLYVAVPALFVSAGTPYTFYQPVVVLEGDGDFVAYVPAVTAEYYGADTQAGN